MQSMLYIYNTSGVFQSHTYRNNLEWLGSLPLLQKCFSIDIVLPHCSCFPSKIGSLWIKRPLLKRQSVSYYQFKMFVFTPFTLFRHIVLAMVSTVDVSCNSHVETHAKIHWPLVGKDPLAIGSSATTFTLQILRKSVMKISVFHSGTLGVRNHEPNIMCITEKTFKFQFEKPYILINQELLFEFSVSETKYWHLSSTFEKLCLVTAFLYQSIYKNNDNDNQKSLFMRQVF